MREVARALGLLAAVILCDSARGQSNSDTIARLVATDATHFLTSADPVVRGEAALVVASQHLPQNHAAICAIAKDPDEAARVRGILALGLQATPGVTNILDDLLLDVAERTKPPGLAAAYALGSLPPDTAPTLVSRVLTSFLQASLKRQREVMLALLSAMRAYDQTPQLTALRRLFAEEANRDPEVRALLLALLLPIDPELDGPSLRKLLERGTEAERSELTAWLSKNPCRSDAELLPFFERLATQSIHPEVRAQALAVLTRMRHLPALEMAAKALRSKSPLEVAQGVRSAMQIGGSAMRGALERHVAAETDPDLQAAMLRAWSSPPSPDLADLCSRLARERQQPAVLRTAATLLLARSSPQRAAPMLRDLFRETDHIEFLPELAAALAKGEGGEAPLARLVANPTDLRQDSQRWRALLAVEHPEAVRHLLALLQDRSASTADLENALRIWREASTDLTPERLAAIPFGLAPTRSPAAK